MVIKYKYFSHLLSSGTITDDLEKLLQRAEKMNDSYEIIEKGPDVVVSSAMPMHNTSSAVSLFTKQAIQVYEIVQHIFDTNHAILSNNQPFVTETQLIILNY